jgi:hypothetical protein
MCCCPDWLNGPQQIRCHHDHGLRRAPARTNKTSNTGNNEELPTTRKEQRTLTNNTNKINSKGQEQPQNKTYNKEQRTTSRAKSNFKNKDQKQEPNRKRKTNTALKQGTL